MSVADEVVALRTGCGLSLQHWVTVTLVSGPDRRALLEHASTRPLFVREGQLRHTLFLREDAGLYADVLIASAEEGLYVLAEGPAASEIARWLEAMRAEKAPRSTVRSLADDLVVIGIDGPYAWEVVSALLGPPVLGMPYLTLLQREGIACCRAGKTGEFGYLLLVERALAATTVDQLTALGESRGLIPVGLSALDTCALENWHFSMRSLGPTALAAPLTPLELQLKWRVDPAHDFFGAAALRVRREAGSSVRATCFTSRDEITSGAAILLDGAPVGEVLAACPSPTLGGWVGSALLPCRWAHPHLDFVVPGVPHDLHVRTHTTPLVDNLSLRIDPHKHAYATREHDFLPSP
jgi:glycine cleavage system aminomethyltransferase T